MDFKNAFDVSSYLFFEATGDSEADPDVVDPNIAISTIKQGDDDAESCSYNLSGIPFAGDVNNGLINAHAVRVDDDEEEGEEVDSYSTWNNEENKRNEELMSEMEKNRQFWETCLAS